MRKAAGFVLFILFFSTSSKAQPLNDNCSNATFLCANSTLHSTNVNATMHDPTDPSSCGNPSPKNSVWFNVKGINNDSATITISNVLTGPGLTVEAYTGTCGSLVTTGQCATGIGTQSITFTTTTGTLYYIMVSGTKAQTFDILATSSTNSIVAKPNPDFIADPDVGCVPLTDSLINTSTIFGGTNITYQWKFNSNPFVSSSGLDTSVTYNSFGIDTIFLKVSNNECGNKTVFQEITVEKLVPSIGFSPSPTCIGTPVQFTGSAVILPDSANPNITSWSWNFGDPNSGANNTSSLQNPIHTFVGPGASFNVQLIVQGLCGPDTANLTVNLLAQPVLNPGADQTICQGTAANLNASVTGGANPITYTWSGTPSITCSSCASTTVTGLLPGGPYTYSIHIVDAHGCIADSLTHVTVHPKPVVNAGNDTTVCKYTALQLNANVTAGTSPFTFSWSPSAGLDSPLVQKPIATITSAITYCVTVMDSIGCTSDPDCITISVHPPPTVTPSPAIFCSSDPGPYVSTITVSSDPGSSYQWKLSTDYIRITGAVIPDSSVITVTLPTGVVANYNFTVIVNDIVTGCTDTVSVTIPVIAGVPLSVNGPFTICVGNSASLVASGANVYAWTASPPYVFGDPTQANQTVSPAVTTIFIVKGTVGSCSKTDSILVTVNPKPVVNAGTDTIVCKNTSLVLNANVTAGTSPFTYSWSPAAGLDDPAKQSPTATVTDSITYCVTVKDPIGCTSDPDCIVINVYPTPTVSSSHAPYCASDPRPDTITLTVSVSGAIYHWNASPNYGLITGTNFDSSSVQVTLPPVPGSYSFTVIVTNPATGCIDTISTTLAVISGLTTTVNGPFTICNGSSVMLTDVGGTSYAWTASPSYVFADSTLANQNVSPTVNTTFFVLATTGSCTKLDSIHVTVNPVPVAMADSISPFCGCATVALNDAGSTPGMNYLWTSKNGSIIANPNAQVTTATVCAPDTFTLTVTDPVTSCSQFVSMPANSLPKPAAAADVTPPLICNGTSTTATLDGTGSNIDIGTTYLWSSVPAVSIVSPTALNTTATVTGFTVFSLTVTTVAGCDSTVTDTVNIYPPPTISISPGDLCTTSPSKIDTVTINGASLGAIYNWTGGIPGCVTPSSVPSSTQSQAFDFSSCGVGSYSFIVIVTDVVTTCVTTLTKSMNVVNGVPLVTSPNQAICEGDSVILFASGANQYLWSDGETKDTIVVKGLTAAMSPKTFTVAGSIGTCIDIDTIIITINPKPVTSAINGPIKVCAKDTTAIFSVTENAGDIYTWSVTNGSISSGQLTDSIVVKWTGPGPATVTVHETNSSGCVSADQTLNVTVNPNPVTSSILGKDSVCANSTDTYSVNPVAGSTFQWSVSGGAISGPSTGTSVVAVWGAGPAGTVKVVETNAVGCSGDTVFLNVTILPLPSTPAISGPDSLCDNSFGVYSVTDNPGSFWLWTVIGGTILSPPDSATIALNWDSVGTDTLIVMEVTANGCISPADTMIVIIEATPVTTAINGNNSVCPNDTSIYSVFYNAGDIYSWTVSGVPGGNIVSGQNTDSITVAWSGAGTGLVSVTESTPIGCTGLTQNLNVTINPKPVTSPVIGKDTACQNSTQQYSVDSTSGSTYQWFVTGGVISGSSTDTMVSVIWSAPPTGTIEVVETSGKGCVGDTDSLNVTILPAPATPVVNGMAEMCANTKGVVYSVTNNAGSYYLWTVTGATDTIVSPLDSTSQITVNWGNPGIDTVSVNEVNASNGCPSLPGILIVTLDIVPTTSPIIGDSSVCEFDRSVLYYVIGDPLNTFTWTVTGGSNSFPSTTDTLFVDWDTAGIGTITVIETTPGGCSGPLQQDTIRINPLPDSTLILGANPDSACAGSIVRYVATGNAGSTFAWTATGGNFIGSSIGDTVFVQWTLAGSGFLQVTETSKDGCIGAPASKNVVVNPLPNTSSITGNLTACITDTGIYYVDLTAGSTYVWSISGGTILNQNSDTITVTWDTTGANIISVIETNFSGCVDTIPVTKVVTVNALPVASASASKTTLCQNDTVQLTGVDSNTVSVNWYTSGSGTFNDTTALSPIYTAGATDSGTVTLTMLAHNLPCVDAVATVILTVNPVPHVTIMPSAPSICIGDSDTLTVSGIGSYIWTPGNDTTSSIVVNPATTATYTVQVTNSYGCSSIDSVTVTVIPQGVATAGANQNICTGDSVFLSGGVAKASGGVWTSTGNGTFIPNDSTLNATYVPGIADTTAFHLILTTTGACLNGSDSLLVLVGFTPIVKAGPDQTIAYKDSAHLAGVVTYAGGIWTSNGTGTFIPNDSTLNAIYIPSSTDLQQDSIVLTLTSINGCRIVSDFMVIHFIDFVIPNVFTPYPNSPGYNDYFEMKGLPPNSTLKVWNRWGLLVFESNNYRNDWDAAGLASDTYYYVVLTTKNEYHGWVTVIK